ncbi:hypothetical protein BKG82_27090 [Mycobacteroides chelonae]|uniref:Uncharacterized protein n=1 Tax=Mycobacteroides chelonae TaxID=1774 RepID=A0A1S1LG88_MYCCH|nr:hypothetical protein [Mycobacteroides chelonae]OHU47320.1 hypothetical protein BKG82_27090 [Mycobacteroides chelonae]
MVIDPNTQRDGDEGEWRLPGPRPRIGDRRMVGMLHPDGSTSEVLSVVTSVGDSQFRAKLLDSNDSVSTEDYVGLSESEATAKAEDAGYQVRITARDENHYVVTRDFRETRLNFELRHDQIVRAYVG